jgi:23S rRNA (uracil1939-C5)-methyltransferase
VEIVDQAVKDAYFNAEINGIQDRVAYFVGKAERIVKQGAVKEDFLIGGDVLIVDPPREGLHKDVVTFLGQLYQQHPYRLLYVSCNPTTMLRDIMLLA